MYAMDAGAALARMSAEKRKFDIVFLDPPYGKGLELSALSAMKRYGLLAEDATVIVETAIEDAAVTEVPGYRVTRVKEYKTNRHVFQAIIVTGEKCQSQAAVWDIYLGVGSPPGGHEFIGAIHRPCSPGVLEKKRRGKGKLAESIHRRTGRVDSYRSQISSERRYCIAEGYGTGSTVIVVCAQPFGVVHILRPRTHCEAQKSN